MTDREYELNELMRIAVFKAMHPDMTGLPITEQATARRTFIGEWTLLTRQEKYELYCETL